MSAGSVREVPPSDALPAPGVLTPDGSLRALLATVQSVAVMLDAAGRVTFANGFLLALTGWTAEEVLGTSWFDRFIPVDDAGHPRRDRDGLRRDFHVALAAGEIFPHAEHEILTRAGARRVVAWDNAVLRDADGRVTGTVSLGRDVTDERARAAALARSERDARATFDQAAVGMARLRLGDGRWIAVNEALCRMLGYARDEMLQRTWGELTHPDDRHLGVAEWTAMAAGTLDAYALEKRYLHRDGHAVWARLTISLVRDADGRPDYELAIIEDVTARRAAEAALRRSEERYALAARASHNAIWDWDLATDDLTWNDGVHDVFAYARGAVPRGIRWWYDTIHADDRDRVLAGIHRVIDSATGSAWEDRYRFRRGDGAYADVVDRGFVARDAGGRPLRMIGAMQDASAERAATRAQDRLLAAEREARRAAEDARVALALAHRRLDAALIAGEVGTFEWDIVQQRVSGDANFARMFGIPLDADGTAPLDRYVDVIHPDDRDTMRAAVARTVMDGDDYEVEYRVLGDAAPRWLLVRAKPERDAEGRVVHAAGVCLDVTDRRRAEAEAGAERRRLARILDRLPVGVIVASPDAQIRFTNAATTTILGSPIPQGEGSAAVGTHRLLHTDGSAYADDEYPLARALRGETVDQELARYRRADGSEATLAISAAPLRVGDDGTGPVDGAIAAFVDVHERESARREAERTRAQLARVLDAIGEAFVTYDREWRYTHVNWKAAELLGRPVEELLGRSPWEVFPETAGSESHAAHLRAASAGTAVTLEVHYAPWDRWFENRIHPSPDGASTFFQDITERKRAEERVAEAMRRADAERVRAEQANRAKADFLANMSHELRTPLNAIGGYVQLLDMGLHGPVTEAQRSALARVEAAQRHLLRLINDVLNFAKLEAGKVEYDVRPVRLGDVLDAVAPLIEPQMAARGHAFRMVVADPERRVLADRDKLQQVLLNLLSNAVKFTAEGGRVALDTPSRADGTTPAGWAYLRVADTGLGVARERQASIFEPFVQVDTSHTRTAEGTGLGLAISRDLARGMGGDLRVRSAEGEGAAFTIALRLAPSGDAPPGDAPSGGSASR